jgi:hypothetical protein
MFIATGEEYIDEWKNPQTGAVTFYCSLCGCQFDNKLIVPHTKDYMHKKQYQVNSDLYCKAIIQYSAVDLPKINPIRSCENQFLAHQ